MTHSYETCAQARESVHRWVGGCVRMRVWGSVYMRLFEREMSREKDRERGKERARESET